MHKIKIEKEFKADIQVQRHLCPTMKYVVKTEVFNLFEAIYHISDTFLDMFGALGS